MLTPYLGVGSRVTAAVLSYTVYTVLELVMPLPVSSYTVLVTVYPPLMFAMRVTLDRIDVVMLAIDDPVSI